MQSSQRYSQLIHLSAQVLAKSINAQIYFYVKAQTSSFSPWDERTERILTYVIASNASNFFKMMENLIDGYCEIQRFYKFQTSFIFSDHLIQSTHERKFLALNLVAALMSRVSSDKVNGY